MPSEVSYTPTFKRQDLIKTGYYINGEWYNEAEQYFEVLNPANNEVIGKFPECKPEIVEKAIDAAAEAFKTYKNTAPRQRAKWLRNMYNLMMDNIEDLAKIITWENGKVSR